MAPRSQTITGRYDESLAELRDLTASVKTDAAMTPPQRLRAIGLAALESLGGVAQPEDTVNLSVNFGETGDTGGGTYTVTVSHTPAPVRRK